MDVWEGEGVRGLRYMDGRVWEGKGCSRKHKKPMRWRYALKEILYVYPEKESWNS